MMSGNEDIPGVEHITLSVNSRLSVLIRGAKNIQHGELRVATYVPDWIYDWKAPDVPDRVFITLPFEHPVRHDFLSTLAPLTNVRFNKNEPSQCFIREGEHLYYAALTPEALPDFHNKILVQIRLPNPLEKNRLQIFRGFLEFWPRGHQAPNWA